MITGGAAAKNYKDPMLSQIVPDVVSECALMRTGTLKNTCLSDEAVITLSKKIGVPESVKIEGKLEAVRKTLKVNDDRDLINLLPKEVAFKEIKNFKLSSVQGVELLSNTDVDTILTQWSIGYPGFYAYSFNMLDYAENSFRNGEVVIGQPDTLATVDPVKVFEEHTCCGCIINSDRYKGPGKHWMALFADNRGAVPTVEFFNSSGRVPAPEWISWMNRAALAIEEIRKRKGQNIRCKIVTYNKVHQYSMTECGVYSLFYVYSRIKGIPIDYFKAHVIKDELMFEFRAHLFTGYIKKDQKMFSLEEFAKNTKIKWDTSSGHREGEI